MTNIVTPTGMLSYPHLFEKQSVRGGTPKFSIALIFDKKAQATDEYKKMKLAEKALIVERFGEDKYKDPAFRRTLRSPFRDAGERQQQGYEPGFIFINSYTEQRPRVVDRKQVEIIDSSEVWAGQLARASLSCFYYDKAGNKGVSFGLNHVQIIKADMPRIDGRISVDKAFGPVEDEDALVDDDVI